MPLYLSILYYWFGEPRQSVDSSASKSIEYLGRKNKYLEMNTRKKPVGRTSSDS